MKSRATYPLDQCALYAMTSPQMLAERLSTPRLPVSVAELEHFANSTCHYSIRAERKPSGGTRKIEEPKPRLQKIHGRVHDLLSRVTLPTYVHSVRKGHSYITNAKQHVGRGELVKLDIEKFYPSVRRAALADFFEHQMCCAKDLAALLAGFLTVDGHLATGSRASPILSYFVNRAMFDKVAALSETRSLTMTLYVDDICISGRGANNTTITAVRKIIADHGLRSHKLRQFKAKRLKVVTGVVVGAAEIRLPNRRHLTIHEGYAALHDAPTPEAKLDILNRLAGQVHEAAQIETRYRPSAVQLDQMRKRIRITEGSGSTKVQVPAE